jgi:hypothetical protein
MFQNLHGTPDPSSNTGWAECDCRISLCQSLYLPVSDCYCEDLGFSVLTGMFQ